ncbi:hypothetical protein A3J20_04600 [Candidatus Gottesmanbacteria bacterium RIFCSPLOWO2_02_FULL_42_29]|uniref:Glycosyltransferase RgtA/B/C/D-like domain-containing protein n=2 Tax=Candidatus Gottesmaniibacteriota TaxID=1752720 RepID=A0A1F6BA45_9BACT|nr:MAG: hypothetical protein UV09_C0008G0017 [Candidatus Gottesmanbacteria bacterium GW2011_GWA2_42_18]OGG09763.1 MAG: hypothetical protein A2781_05550 [Candidatus Gottesmanbacteria bacterium RIFCSPHIGHO2_01_FULL_42_27]OGG20171.1 MAG: hypothetical protein A3E72_01275 [Candidatus Gottesmanbacteria bacterium RIFCSPHIGHO2_12_FULL_43_26]OGG33387.1 MAG: hypothetical protein A2968_01170 [Candidatus Gottesmanbacteria bacterium RIFCSPLOWO2_01_FULL_42_22]OGG37826.1 MAG: hypothetical protein A3J20_04600 
MPKNKTWKIISWLIALFILALLLYFRLDLGIRRYFDIDEFAHLHWGYNLFLGQKPYADFFYLFPPFFLYPVAFIMSIFGRSAVTLIAARIFIFTVFAGICLFLYLLSSLLSGRYFALAVVAVFAFLPMPYDKMLEIRPDLPSLLMSMAGLYFFIRGREKRNPPLFFLAGLSFASSLALVPKSLFMLLPPVVILLKDFFSSKDDSKKMVCRNYLSFSGGLLLPAVVLGLIALSTGKVLLAFYSMTKLSAAGAKSLSKQFYMRPDLFFYPNDTYYGFSGYHAVYLTNLIIWIGGAVYSVWQFMSSFSQREEKQAVRSFLLSGVFLANLFAFVNFFPLKHAQYLIPSAPFAALFFTKLWFDIWRKVSKRLAGIAVLAGLIYICFLGFSMYRIKKNWTNGSSLNKLESILGRIPSKTPVFDLTGETVFFPDGYYFCCLPYGQYQETLLFDYPSIESYMDKKNTRYVHAGTPERLNVLPDIQRKYLEDNFSWSDFGLMVRK